MSQTKSIFAYSLGETFIIIIIKKKKSMGIVKIKNWDGNNIPT